MVHCMTPWFGRENLMDRVVIYDEALLPAQFRYPRAFVELARQVEQDALYPWFLFAPEGDVGRLALSIGMSHKPRLVPFASLEGGDGDLACFDGEDSTGDPAVIMLIVDRSGRSYGFRNFEDWLRNAKKS